MLECGRSQLQVKLEEEGVQRGIEEYGISIKL